MCCATASGTPASQPSSLHSHIRAVVAAKVAVRRGVDVAAAGAPGAVGTDGQETARDTWQRSTTPNPMHCGMLLINSSSQPEASPVAAALEVQGLADHAGAEVEGGLDCSQAGAVAGRQGRRSSAREAVQRTEHLRRQCTAGGSEHHNGYATPARHASFATHATTTLPCQPNPHPQTQPLPGCRCGGWGPVR